jgi:hypothetical protein
LTSLIPITPTTDTFTWALDKTSYYSIILGYHVIEDWKDMYEYRT